ncbi:predicted protein [Chaetoceros tenuissimus]|uniref:Uncharacterized protein n=1 Tax=Chaetoceros tenuissimus TaxID=426638 RepID=A0AAD3CQ46_9STRA|nr:predicted protein [Chaetoceros tenuissimus]
MLKAGYKEGFFTIQCNVPDSYSSKEFDYIQITQTLQYKGSSVDVVVAVQLLKTTNRGFDMLIPPLPSTTISNKDTEYFASLINADVCTEIMRSNKFKICGGMVDNDKRRVSAIKHLHLKRIGKMRGWMKRSKIEPATIAKTVRNEKHLKKYVDVEW